MPDSNQRPLGLPAGSVRAIIALTLTGAIIAAIFVKVDIPEITLGFLGAIIGFYFGSRNNDTPTI